jgi:Tfp pilus assembly protein PilO
MGLSKRERMIVLITIIAVGALVADRLVRAPLANRLGQLKSERQELAGQVAKAQNLFERKSQQERKWKTLLSEGLRSDAEAEGLVAKALDKWAEDARLTLTSIKPDRMAGGDKGLKEILFVVAGKGSLDAVAWFLYQVEISELPIKVKHMQLGSTSESGGNMSLELRISALYLAADEKSSQKQSQPKPKETNNEEQLL